MHVRTPEPVTLERRTEDTPWQEVCASPCDAEVPVEGSYRITGDGVHKSRGFHLHPDGSGQVTLDVEPGSSLGHTAGVIMVIGGIPATAVGAVMLLVSLLPSGGNLAVPGAFVFFGGAAVTVGGVAFVGSNKTSVTQGGQAPPATVGRGAVLPSRGTGLPIVSLSF